MVVHPSIFKTSVRKQQKERMKRKRRQRKLVPPPQPIARGDPADVEEDFLVKLENCKTQLVEVSERALGPVKEAILPLQNQEAGNIKKKLLDFQRKVAEFRIKFQQSCPYHIDQSSI
jgi:hypothetical protein